jgi:gliding motility-associated-like protein
MDVTINFAPTSITLGPDITTCKDTALMLHAGPGFWSYTWQNGTKDSLLNAQTPGLYTVVADNLCGAHYTDSFRLTKIIPVSFAAAPMNPVVCNQDSVQFTASGGTLYSWQPASNFARPNVASSKAWVNANAVFTVAITDAVCNRDTLIAIPVTTTLKPNISITKSNDVNCSNDSAILVASGGLSYSWSPNVYISHTGNGRITVKPPQTQTYTVIGKDATGCVGLDSVKVVFTRTGDQQLFVPSAFTPNGDGLNDIFRPIFTGPAGKYDFRIFNRWGQLIYRSTTPGQGWDGIFRSTLQPNDVYVYYITAEGGCDGKFQQKGTFLLIK